MEGHWQYNSVVVGVFLAVHCYIAETTLVQDTKLYTDTNTSRCVVLSTDDKIREELAVLLERRTKSVEINITFQGYTENPLQDPTRKFYKPWTWVRTTSRHGQALLMLPFHYKMLSLGTLSLGTESMNVLLKDEPTGCLETQPFGKRIVLIRKFLLNDFKPLSQGLTGSLSENEYVCVQRLKAVAIYGDFVHDCCRYGPDGESFCIDLTQEFWINVLQNMLTALKVAIFLFFPLMLPESLYRPLFVQDRYKVKLKKPSNVSIYVTDKPGEADAVECLKRLDAKQLSMWPEFNNAIRSRGTQNVTIPWHQRVTLSMDNLYLQVQKRRLISKNNVPVSLYTYLKNTFVRCKIRQVEPFDTCCKASICGTYRPQRFANVSWLKFCLIFVRFLVLAFVPLPFYLRLVMYSLYEHDEMMARKEALEIRGLREQPSGNAMQYLSPTHPLFVIIYIVYIMEGAGIRLVSRDLRHRFKFVFRESFREMKGLAMRDKLAKAGKKLLHPLETYGCLGFLVGLFYWIFAIPFVLLATCVIYIPMLYLTWRVVYSFICIIAELYKRRGKENQITKSIKGDFQRHTSEFRIRDFLPGVVLDRSKRLMKKPFVREVLLQIFILFCTIVTIYTLTILLVECVGFFVEVFAFTLMGIIVNAGQTMRFVSLLFVLALYMHDCYKTVHDNYLSLGQSIISEAMSRVDNIEDAAYKSSVDQTNTGFVIKSEVDKRIPPPRLQLDKEHELPRWKVFRPLLFLGNTDKPYVSVKFFEAFNTTNEAGCPGPVLNSLLKATGKFLIMVAFLGFVLVVILTFGDSYHISTTNQTLATVVGGMLPWLLRNFVMGKKDTISLGEFGFKFVFDKFVREHSKTWEISDLIISETGKSSVQPKASTSEPEMNPDQPEVSPDEPEVTPEQPEDNTRDLGDVLDPTDDSEPENYVAVPTRREGEIKVKPVDLLIDLSHNVNEVEFVSIVIQEPLVAAVEDISV